MASPSPATRASSARAGAGGDDSLDGAGKGGGELSFTNGETETVCSLHGDLVALGGEQNAGEHRAGFVGGGGKCHLLDSLLQLSDVDGDSLA